MGADNDSYDSHVGAFRVHRVSNHHLHTDARYLQNCYYYRLCGPCNPIPSEAPRC
jgi:hypothetical protein